MGPRGVGHARRYTLQITALGHSCILLDFEEAPTGRHTRILIDPWLSDHATGDGMGRFPRLRFQPDDLAPIHGVFISHAHSDHLDPYTLLRLWRTLPQPPTLFLPISLAFLVPVFHAHIPECDIQLLSAHTPVPFRGIELMGFFDINFTPTNEDDVMILVARSGSEVAVVEVDANLSLEDPDFRAFVSSLVTAPGIESAVFLTTENELEGTLLSKDCRSTDDRIELAEQAMGALLDSVQDLYEPTDDPDDLWHCPYLVRLIHGQGLTAPHELDPRWQRILFPVRIEHRVREERAAARRAGFGLQIDRLTDGAVHTIAAGRITDTTPLAGMTRLDHERQRRFDPHLDFFPVLPCAPLRSEERDAVRQRGRILALLNQRFVPYLHGGRQPPVLHLLASYGGAYRVRVHYGRTVDTEARDYVLGFGARGFIEQPAGDEHPQETYWANDLDDFLDGRCDEFSTFCRSQFPDQEIRLQVCLSTPLLNSDLVEKRIRLHFERAREGMTPGSWVLPLFDL